jgi:hypothetical protein
MLYRIKAAQSEWLLVRQTLDSVMKVVRRKSQDFPVGQEFQVFRGDKLVATSRREPLFDRDPCVYRKLKLGRSGGEVRQGWRVI